MIRYPISNRDLFRSVMMHVPAAGVRYSDPVLQEFAEDEQLGLCEMRIVKLPEEKKQEQVYDINYDGWRVHETTVQRHEVQVEYHDSELEFLKALESGGVISKCNTNS